MSRCKFIVELNRLSKSSSDSIDNIETFDNFKRYMHVPRNVEKDLKDVLRKVNLSSKKTLVLLCGSAGDGKSHLLSYLRNSDEEKLINGYKVYNDATESSAPLKTAIDTLSDVLIGFRDENLERQGQSIILAINLGVLSNFIESEYSCRYQKLKYYVEKSNILTSQINEKHYDYTSYFQHVSFSDYHMYSLTADGVSPDYIEEILKKIFADDIHNPFYSTYSNDCAICTLSEKCPVKKNYEFMMNKVHQKFIARLLVKTTIKDKEIITTREILNYIYNILVAHNFSFTKYQKLMINDANFLKEFIKEITPVLMFDYSDMTSLMNQIKKYDPLFIRSEEIDEQAVSYYVSSDVSKKIKQSLMGSPYASVLCNHNVLPIINDDKVLKSKIFNVLLRNEAMNICDETDKIYSEYLKNLYYYNAGIKKKLQHIYSMVEDGIIQWCGSESNDNICLLNKYYGFTLYENIKFNEHLDNIPPMNNMEKLQKFRPVVIIDFEDKDNQEVISLELDYSLYELIYKLSNGYIQTADDRNNHADFISFISKILRTGSSSESVLVVSENGQKAKLEKTNFGYKFKVVR